MSNMTDLWLSGVFFQAVKRWKSEFLVLYYTSIWEQIDLNGDKIHTAIIIKKCQIWQICGFQVYFSSCRYSKIRFRPPPDPAGWAYDVPPGPLVGLGGGHFLILPFPARRLPRLDLGAFGASVVRPPPHKFVATPVADRLSNCDVSTSSSPTTWDTHAEPTHESTPCSKKTKPPKLRMTVTLSNLNRF